MRMPSADIMIANELEKSLKNQPKGDNVKENEVYKALAAEFPAEAIQGDSSRGFALTTIKAQYIRERLNEVLGIMGWSFGGEYEEREDGSVLFKGGLVFTVEEKQNRIFSVGYSAKKKNVGDSYKSANTDSLSKCASFIGVGNSVFKGLVDPDGSLKSATAKPTARAKKAEAKAEGVKPAAKTSSFKNRSAKKTVKSELNYDDI